MEWAIFLQKGMLPEPELSEFIEYTVFYGT
jgi:hypothetical protein